MPSIADPGSDLIRRAHDSNFKVVPHVGPSSLLLALSSSGMNGQSFSFHGYLPIKTNELKSKLKELEIQSLKFNISQLFIETPYRNDRMLENLISNLNPQLRLCVARDITGVQEMIISQPIAWWKKNKNIEIGKLPAIFIIGK